MTTGVGSGVAEAALAAPAVGIAGSTTAVRAWTGAVRRLPIIAHLAVYLFTCYVGTLALVMSERFRSLYLLFSGAQPPDLTRHELVIALALLHLSPLLVWAGFEIVLPLAGHRLRGLGNRGESGLPSRVVEAAFVLSAALACWSIYRGGGFRNFAAWLDYNAYVHARLRLFDSLGFWEFVNLYTVLPLLTVSLILARRRWQIAVLCVVLLTLVQWPLAQRKILLTSGILMAAAGYIHLYVGAQPRRRAAARSHLWIMFGTPVALYAVYLVLTLLPIVFESSRGYVPTSTPPPAIHRAATPPPDVAAFGWKVREEDTGQAAQRDRKKSIALYTALAPLNRTSIAALAYPAIFPRWRPYYHVDFGQDMLRHGGLSWIKRMPDDNLVVYRILWPQHDVGAIGAPFQYVLYSQGGFLLACVGSLVVGAILAACWGIVGAATRPSVETSVFGALIIVLGIFLALDSVRNSVAAGYGVGWGFLVLLFVSFVRIRQRTA